MCQAGNETQNGGRNARGVAALVAVLACALVLSRAFFHYLERETNNSNFWLKARLRGVVQALPEIARPGAAPVLVFGASDVESSFIPEVFDQELRERGIPVTSYNLAVRN